MTDPNTQKQEQTDDNKVSVDPQEKPKSQDELTIEDLAKVSGGAKPNTTFGRHEG
jgi:bacteriocin-like protein